MEAISCRNGAQLTNPSSSTRAPCGDLDIDFHDVFGGPPRRSSIQDIRMYRYASEDDIDEDRNKFRSSWSGVGEKPVFGGENVNRRGHAKDYFFDDIFKAGESMGKHDREAYPSPPGSRALSPARHLPSKPVPSWSSSLPAQFSLPENLSKGVDLPAFVSTAHSRHKTINGGPNGTNYSSTSNVSPPRSSNESIKGLEELRHAVRSYRPTPLSQEFSLSSDGSPVSTRSDNSDKGEKSRRDFDSGNMKSNIQFHFSIYKWAGKGIPSLLPVRNGRRSRLSEKSKLERSSSPSRWNANGASPMGPLHNQNISSVIDSATASRKSFRKEPEKQEDDSLLDTRSENIGKTQHLGQEAVVIIAETEILNSHQGIVSDVSCDNILQNAAEHTESHSSERVLHKKSEKEISVENQKPAPKTLRSFFYDKEDKLGSRKVSRKAAIKENREKIFKKSSVANLDKNIKKKDEKESTQSDVQLDKSSMQGTSVNIEDNLGTRRVKGKVKDFINIFNKEISPRSKINLESPSKNTKLLNERTSKEENKANAVISKTKERSCVPDANSNRFSPAASIKVDEYLQKSENHHCSTKTNDYVFANTSSGQESSSASYKASVSDVSKATFGVSQESFAENFLVEGLSQAEDTTLQANETQVVIDTKIKRWSNGKEGNIRSLLSTMQYVLWPESGWKPVPLVDIIEPNAVKRAYQKALLCLHPDKLQQKGAASHQKYIAEKVFDILQEAWNHFSTFSSLEVLNK